MANIFAEYSQPVRSVADYQNDYDKQALVRGQLVGQTRINELAALQADQQRQTIGDTQRKQNALRIAAQAAGPNADPNTFATSLLKNPDTMDAGVALQKHLADTGKVYAATAKDTVDVEETKRKALLGQVAALNSPDDALALIEHGVQSKTLPQPIAAALQNIVKTDPRWQLKLMLGIGDPSKMAELLKPHFQEVTDGKIKTFPDMNPITNPAGPAPITMTTTPGEDSTAATARAGQAVQLAGQRSVAATAAAGQRSTAQTAREGHAIQAAAAGIDPQTGNFIVGPGGKSQFQGLIDEIGSNQISQSTALARVPPGVKAQILEQVRQQYPDYRVEDYAAKNAAFKAYTDPNSKSAAEIKASNTALNHLETIKALADAQNNGNLLLFNKIANAWSMQTGQAAPKNMRDAALMVGPEISKAVVGTGGGVGERGDFVKALGGDYSPAQIAGTAATMQELLGGRLSETERSYNRSTGRKDFRSDAYLSPAAQKILSGRDARTNGASPAAAAPVKPGDIHAQADAILRGGK